MEGDLIHFTDGEGQGKRLEENQNAEENQSLNQKDHQIDLLLLDDKPIASFEEPLASSQHEKESTEVFEDIAIKQSNLELNATDGNEINKRAEDDDVLTENEDYGTLNQVHFGDSETAPSQTTELKNAASKIENDNNEFSELVSSMDNINSMNAISNPYIYASTPVIPRDADDSALLLPDIMTRSDFFSLIPSTDLISEAIRTYNPSSYQGQRRLLLHSEVPQSIEGLEILAASGCWRSVARLAQVLITSCQRSEIDLALKLWTFRIAAILRLGLFEAAWEEILAIGPLNKKQYQYEEYPSLFQGRQGSMVPWDLRLFEARLYYYHLKNTDLALSKLYELSFTCRKALYFMKKQKAQIWVNGYLREKDFWERSLVKTYYSLVHILLCEKDFSLAFSVLEEASKFFSSDCGIYFNSLMGRLLLQFGNLKEASKLFQKVDVAYAQASSLNTSIHGICMMNKGFYSMALGKWDEAHRYWNEALTLNPQNLVVINNTGICLFYQGKVSEATAVIERIFHTPSLYPTESVLSNLSILYELSMINGSDKKLELLNIASKMFGDTIDVVSCLRLSSPGKLE